MAWRQRLPRKRKLGKMRSRKRKKTREVAIRSRELKPEGKFKL